MEDTDSKIFPDPPDFQINPGIDSQNFLSPPDFPINPGKDSHVTIETPKNDHNSDSDHATDSSNTKTSNDKPLESESSVSLLKLVLDWCYSKTPIFLVVLIGLKIVFLDLFVPLGAVCSDFWQV